jgi:Tol biopolymer transport system component
MPAKFKLVQGAEIMTCVYAAKSYLTLVIVCCAVSLMATLSTALPTSALGAPQSASPTPPPVHSGLPVVSPNGAHIAFNSNSGGDDDLFVISTNGKEQRQLTHTPESEGNLAWTTDGKEILFSVFKDGTSRLFAVDANGKNQRELAKVPGRAPTLSPDGKRLVYMAGTWTATRLTVSLLDGSNARQITDDSSIAWNNHWSPDGKRIAFTSRENPQSELAVFVMNGDGSSRRQVTHVPAEEGGAQWPVWSPDGQRFAIQVNSRTQKNSAHLWIVDVARGEAHKLAAHTEAYVDETPSWFPNGKRIAFQSNRSGQMEVWVMKTDGSGARQITGVPKVR